MHICNDLNVVLICLAGRASHPDSTQIFESFQTFKTVRAFKPFETFEILRSWGNPALHQPAQQRTQHDQPSTQAVGRYFKHLKHFQQLRHQKPFRNYRAGTSQTQTSQGASIHLKYVSHHKAHWS